MNNRSLGQYFKDVGEAIKAGGQKPDAETDTAFKTVANAITPLVPDAQNMEDDYVWTAKEKMDNWTNTMASTGRNNAMDVEGKASKKVAKQLIAINASMINGEYQPDNYSLLGIGFWARTNERNTRLTNMNAELATKIQDYKSRKLG